MNKKLWIASLTCGLLSHSWAQTEQRQLTIDTKELGIEISPTLSGLFFEDINQSLDGGICAQMIQNNSFQAYNVPDGPANEFSQSDTIFFGWTVVKKKDAVGEARTVSDHPLVKELERKYNYDPNDKYDDELRYAQYCVRFDIKSAGEGFGIAANGYGITPTSRERGATYSNNTQRPSLPVVAKTKYDLGLYLQGEQYKGKVSVWLEDIDGNINSNVLKISKLTDEWKKFTGTLKAKRSKDSRLVIMGDAAGTFYLDFVTLLPEASQQWKKGKAGPFRKDMMEALASLNPTFMRFPGGCASEGPNYFGQPFWKNSIGAPEERIGFRNHWGYLTSQYVGFYEYFLMAESLGASPLPVLNNGVTCQFAGHQYVAPLDTEEDRQRFYDIFVKDALDLIEFCNGPITSTWGKVRAEMGHPKPFNLKYLGIGNENRGEKFWERFDIIYKAVKAQYPDIIIVSTSGAFDAGREFDANYKEIDSKYADTYVDEHYYKNDEWFFNNTNRYAPNAKRGGEGMTYDRSKPTRVFVGEFANNNTNNAYHSTLAEAAYWLSLEQNSDMVVMAAYAPLFCKKGYNKWNSNLIWFDNRGLWRTTNYYYQQLFSKAGNRALKHCLVMNGNKADEEVHTSATINTETGEVYVKFVNAEAQDKQVSISINKEDSYIAELEYITSHDTSIKNQGDQNYYSSHPDADSSFNYNEPITPQLKRLGKVKGTFSLTMPENSVGVLRLNKK
ncbi:MAG: alpha-L-arabinofuranosidase [Paludibacteraceae bacterium]|nr:alpha-L-arabinofuranosidase [Bacteroidaceae bacterium]MBR6803912.1 alpha-L-arabinofuranosidase [Paludibacteraceae bacterium]